MASLWKRATPRQYRMLRAISGAVKNTAHAHSVQLPKNFEHGVAKRAVGTLTAQWPDVLAADRINRSQNDPSVKVDTHGSRQNRTLLQVQSLGGRLRLLRRSPIKFAWKEISQKLWKIKREGTPAQYMEYVEIMRLLDQADRKLKALEEGSSGG